MESLSRPFHSRKLSNATTFSTKNAYDGVFSGHRRKFTGASVISVEDYREIFGSSQAASSIPVLDFSNLVEPSGDVSLNFRSSNPDYSKIFGGFRDEQVAVSYDELFARDKARSPSSKTETSQDSVNFSHKSPDALKQFNMSYNKITPKSKDELDNNTKYVTQVHATPGFTHFIDEQVPVNPPKMEPKNQKPSPVHVSKFVSDDKTFKTSDIEFKKHPSKTDSCKNGFDVNSDASASAAALIKAIEKAQESIRIAKESVGRKKKGLKSFSNKTFKDSLKVKIRMEDVTAATSSQVFHDNSEKLFVAKKVIDEINGKFSESTKECCKEFEVTCETESKLLDSTEKDEYASCSSEAVNEENNVFVDDYEEKIEVTEITIVKEVESIESVCEIGEKIEADVAQELKENKDDVILSNSDELFEELNNLIVSENEKILNEKEDEFLEQEDIEKRSDDEESEMIYDVCELEMNEDCDNILQESEMNLQEIIQENDYTSEIKEENLDDQEFDDNVTKESEMIYDVCELEMNEDEQTCDNILQENEIKLQDDCEIKQENDYTSEIKEENLDAIFDQEFDDNVTEESEVDLQDNFEIKQENVQISEIKEENLDHEFEYIVVEEIDSTNDNNLEEVVDDNVELSEKICTDQTASDDYQVKSEENDTKSEENEINSEENDINSEENDIKSEEYDIKSEENKINSEENNVKMEFEESNKEKNILEETNIQLPQITAEINQKHEISETGTSKVSGKQSDEITAKNNRLAVDRAIREARERAFAEARERADRERAAVEKATQEVRQRMMAEAREKVAKATVGNNKSSNSKLKAERAAVERATSEARQRALEKAISQKTVSDLNSSESALRTKAKLEKHNRIMERAAKALAEKEKRDLLAQKEQAERNRLSENLDADIKRWSNGKEGNLRALLATLQYILGPESGWQAVTLTEIISSSAVKKAYRKATLCVHPDKLQQRGASVQQKYICEKVFDLLKAAWNRFNSEER